MGKGTTGMSYRIITLTEIERRIGRWVGKLRQEEAERMGLEDKYGFEGDPLACHINGAMGEMASARCLGVYWPPSVNTFRAPDLFCDLQVRTRSRHNYDLIVRPGDQMHHAYVCVTGEDGEYRVHGWLWGHEAECAGNRETYGGRPEAFFVPQVRLHDLRDLRRLILEWPDRKNVN